MNGQYNCGPLSNPYCLSVDDLKIHPKHCGDCRTQCDPEQYCNDGQCEISPCILGCNLYNADCNKSTNTQCGSQCENCETIHNVVKAICDINEPKHKCKIIQCREGYTLSSLDAGNSCVENSDVFCGLVNKEGENCTLKKGNVGESFACNTIEGKCVLLDTNCCKDKKAFDSECNQKTYECKINMCMQGYHKEFVGDDGRKSIACVKNDFDKCAPPDLSDLELNDIIEGKNPSLAYPLDCTKLYKYNEESVLQKISGEIADAQSSCDPFGYCDVVTCPEGFHIERFKKDFTPWYNTTNATYAWHEICVQNSIDRCAPPNSYLPTNCLYYFGASGIECNSQGLCDCDNGNEFVSISVNNYEKNAKLCAPKCDTKVIPSNSRAIRCSNKTYFPNFCMPGYRINGNECVLTLKDECGSAMNTRINNCQNANNTICTEDGLCRFDACGSTASHLNPSRNRCEQSEISRCGLENSTMAVICKDSTCKNGICTSDQPGVFKCNGVIVGSSCNSCAISDGSFVCKGSSESI